MMTDIDNEVERLLEEGDELFDNEQYEEACKKYEEITQIPKRLFEQGDHLFDNERYEEACKKYEEVTQILADYVYTAYLSWSGVLLKMRNYSQAIEKARIAVEKKVTFEEGYLQWFFILYEIKQYDEAHKKLDELIGIDPNNGENYSLKSLLYRIQGNYKIAKENIKKALEIYQESITVSGIEKRQNINSTEDYIDLFFSYGRDVFKYLGYFDNTLDKAEEILIQGLNFDSNNINILIQLVDLYIQKTEQQFNQNSSIYWSKARQVYYKSVDLLKKSLDDHETPNKLCQLGNLYLIMEEVEEAEKYFNKALEKDIESLETNQALGFLYSKKEDFSQAIQYYQRALKIDPDLLNTRSNLGEAYLKSTQLTKAEIEYKKVLKVTDYHVESHIGLGEVYLAMGDEGESDLYSQAIKHFDKAIKISNEREGSKVLNKKELSGIQYLKGYTKIKIYENSVGIKDEKLLLDALKFFEECVTNNPENHQGSRAIEKLKKQKEIARNQNFPSRFAMYIILIPSGLIFLLTNIVFWLSFLPSFYVNNQNNKVSVSQPSPQPTKIPIPNASPQSKDPTQPQTKVAESKTSEPTKINTTEYFLLSFSSLIFALISLYLPQLLKLKISGTGIELEKGSVDQAKIPTSLDIKR
jgi:tetratricopeptide (TPR) repeat protein